MDGVGKDEGGMEGEILGGTQQGLVWVEGVLKVNPSDYTDQAA